MTKTPWRPRGALGLIIALVVLLVAGLTADVTLHVVEAQRISNLQSIIQTTRTNDAQSYNSLLGKYSAVYKQLAATGAKTNETKPEDIAPLPGPTGTPGASGSAGATGASGSDGVGIESVQCNSDGTWAFLYTNGDTQTVSGSCIGATGATGPASTTPGPAGADGVDGTDGADGQPPLSWTYVDDLGVTHSCTRTDSFDPINPTYQCS